MVVVVTQCRSLAPSFTFRALSVSLSQDTLLSVPNGAVSCCTGPLAWPSGDVALLLLKTQNPASSGRGTEEMQLLVGWLVVGSRAVGWWTRSSTIRSQHACYL